MIGLLDKFQNASYSAVTLLCHVTNLFFCAQKEHNLLYDHIKRRWIRAPTVDRIFPATQTLLMFLPKVHSQTISKNELSTHFSHRNTFRFIFQPKRSFTWKKQITQISRNLVLFPSQGNEQICSLFNNALLNDK